MRAAAATLLLVAACSGREAVPSSAPSAGRIALELTWTDAESSKDSHDTIERYRLAAGRLRWETETKGYGEDKIPRRSGEVTLDEPTLVRIIELCRGHALTADAVADGGPLGGPGNTVTVEATITIDGATGRTRAVHPRPWNGPPVDAAPLHRSLSAVRDALAALRPAR